MITRSLFATWMYFQVAIIIKWDLSVFSQEHPVLSLDHFNLKSFELCAEITSTCDENNRTSACAACQQNNDTASLEFFKKLECEISEEVLHNLHALILQAYNKIMYGLKSPRTRKNAEDEDLCDGLVDNCRNSSVLPPSSKGKEPNDECDDLLKDMEEKMIVIIEQLELLVELINDPEQLYIKIAQLQNCVQCLQEQIDVIVRQAAQEIANCYEASLGEVSTCFATQLNERTRKIKELEIMVTTKTVNAIIANVQASNYVEAAIDYRDLKNESLFDGMMTEMFEKGQIESILHFGRALYHNNITGRVNVYLKLMELLKSPEKNDTRHIIFSSFVARDRIEFCEGDKFCFETGLPFKFADLALYLLPRVANVTDEWTVLLRENRFRALILFGSPDVVNFTGKAFHDVLKQLITKSYNQTSKNLSGTLNFTTALRWNSQSLTAFECLLEQANSLEDKLKIAIRMKEKMANLIGPDEKPEIVIGKFEELAKNLPDNIRGLVWYETCTLSFEMDDGSISYLTPTTYFFEGGNRRIGYTQNPNDGRGEHKWKFERVDNGGRFEFEEFRIKNVGYDAYFGSHVPWKYSTGGMWYEYCSVSTPDYFETPRKYYSWRVHFNEVENKVFLYHVGRRAYMTTTWLQLNMAGTRGDAEFTISCNQSSTNTLEYYYIYTKDTCW